MNAKLTKTEKALLEKAARKPHGTLYAMTWYSTSAKCRSNGNRDAAALKGLVRKGLADGYKAESNHAPNSDGWGSTHATEFTAHITDAGRKALTSL